MITLDLTKQWKQLYSPSQKEVSFIEVPEFQFLMADGEGDPNGSESFQEAVHVLYALSYTLKFMVKRGARRIEYRVMPLEGLWWSEAQGGFPAVRKDLWKWRLMIAQPDFVKPEDVDVARDEVRRKKKDAGMDRVRFESYKEGKAAEILYIGPYSEEEPTIARIHEAIRAEGGRPSGFHHEIYLSDVRRTAPAKLKTVLRQPFV